MTRNLRAITGGLVLLSASVLAGCGSSSPSATPLDAPIVSATSSNGTTVLSLALGRLGDPANTFYEMFTSTEGHSAFELTTPSGTTTNGGIVVSGPSGIAAIRQFDLLRRSSLVSEVSGRELGAAEMAPALGGGPSSVAWNPVTKQVALLTASGAVVEGPSIAGPFRQIASLSSLVGSTASCAPTAITAITYGGTGQLGLGLRCSKAGSAGIVLREGTGFTLVASSSTRVAQVLRLDGGSGASFDALESVGTQVRMLQIDASSEAARVVHEGPLAPISGVLVSTAHSDLGGGAYSVATRPTPGTGAASARILDLHAVGRVVTQDSSVFVLVPRGTASPLRVWVSGGGTVHFGVEDTEQILKVAVPYGSAH